MRKQRSPNLNTSALVKVLFAPQSAPPADNLALLSSPRDHQPAGFRRLLLRVLTCRARFHCGVLLRRGQFQALGRPVQPHWWAILLRRRGSLAASSRRPCFGHRYDRRGRCGRAAPARGSPPLRLGQAARRRRHLADAAALTRFFSTWDTPSTREAWGHQPVLVASQVRPRTAGSLALARPFPLLSSASFVLSAAQLRPRSPTRSRAWWPRSCWRARPAHRPRRHHDRLPARLLPFCAKRRHFDGRSLVPSRALGRCAWPGTWVFEARGRTGIIAPSVSGTHHNFISPCRRPQAELLRQFSSFSSFLASDRRVDLPLHSPRAQTRTAWPGLLYTASLLRPRHPQCPVPWSVRCSPSTRCLHDPTLPRRWLILMAACAGSRTDPRFPHERPAPFPRRYQLTDD